MIRRFVWFKNFDSGPVGRQCWPLIILAIRPVIFDCDLRHSQLHSGPAETRGHQAGQPIRRSDSRPLASPVAGARAHLKGRNSRTILVLVVCSVRVTGIEPTDKPGTERNDRVSRECRSHDSGVAPVCACAHAWCRRRRRSGTGHAGAGAALLGDTESTKNF